MKLMILAAMEEEIDKLCQWLEDCEEHQVDSFFYYTGKYNSMDVVLGLTEIGLTKAGIATTTGIIHFQPNAVLNIGTAGAHREDLNPGDIILGKEAVFLSAYKSEPRKKGEGISPSDWKLWESDILQGDPRMLEFFGKQNGLGQEGRLGSGDAYNREADQLIRLRDFYLSDCEDMESYGIYLACKRMSMPVLSIRIISNNEIKGMIYDVKWAQILQEKIYDILKNKKEI